MRLGHVAPNPAVGCVIAHGATIIAEAATAPGGRPHAETQALAEAGAAAKGADVYVTLEPCAHHGVTPPCAEALSAAQVARVLIACRDPFPKVDGRGIEHLRAAGVVVEIGLRELEAQRLNAGFFTRVATGRPLVAIDPDPSTYDADLDLAPDADWGAALDALGAQGLTRVRVAPGGALARAMTAAGWVDRFVAESEP